MAFTAGGFRSGGGSGVGGYSRAGAPSAIDFTNNPLMTNFAIGQRNSGLTRRTVDQAGNIQDVYGGLSAQDEKDIALAPWKYKQGVFNTISPMLTGLMGESGSANFGQIGGSNTPLPQLPNSFVFSPEQTQQAVNAARAQGDQGAATQKEQMAGDLAGRGFSLRSPLALAMQQQADTGARMSNADQERQIRLGHAEQNAKQGLSVGALANQQWQGWNQSDIERRKTQVDSILNSQRNIAALISALGGFA